MIVSGLRLIITLALSILAFAPLASDAQVPHAMPRIGVLGNDSESAEDFRQGLRELGYG